MLKELFLEKWQLKQRDHNQSLITKSFRPHVVHGVKKQNLIAPVKHAQKWVRQAHVWTKCVPVESHDKNPLHFQNFSLITASFHH